MTQPPQPNAPLTFRVTSQSEQLGTTGDGKFQRGVQVSFVTSGGHSGSVFAPLSNFSPQVVEQLIRDRVAQFKAISGITGTV